jgi:hypothetical protein
MKKPATGNSNGHVDEVDSGRRAVATAPVSTASSESPPPPPPILDEEV